MLSLLLLPAKCCARLCVSLSCCGLVLFVVAFCALVMCDLCAHVVDGVVARRCCCCCRCCIVLQLLSWLPLALHAVVGDAVVGACSCGQLLLLCVC